MFSACSVIEKQKHEKKNVAQIHIHFLQIILNIILFEIKKFEIFS